MFAELARFGHFSPQEGVLFGGAEGDRSESFAHSPVGDHAARQVGRFFQIVFGTGAVFFKNEFLGRSPAEGESRDAPTGPIR